MIGRAASLGRDERGIAIVEFALIAPVFLLLLMGIFDFGHRVYLQALLSGAVQKAARDASLETGTAGQTAIDARVRDLVGTIVPTDRMAFERLNYARFSYVGKPEDFTDTNPANGRYDTTECFFDVNGNGRWDADMGKTGLGGADDVVLYRVTVTYRPLFPMWALMGGSDTTRTSAQTVLRNQPYAQQAQGAPKQICP